MYVNGTGSKLIVEYLNKNYYLSPSGYRKTGVVQDENKSTFEWNATTVCDILKNEVYIGNTVQNKVSVVSYKVKKLRKVEKEKYIRVANTHEPIIDKDIFEIVQIIHKERAKKVVKRYDYLLRGLIYCKHCRVANANCIKSKSPLQQTKDSIYCRYRISKKRLLCKKSELSKV